MLFRSGVVIDKNAVLYALPPMAGNSGQQTELKAHSIVWLLKKTEENDDAGR